MYQRVIKRGLDILLCGAAMLIIWPLFLLIAILIKLDSKGPVYFKQKRVGTIRHILLFISSVL